MVRIISRYRRELCWLKIWEIKEYCLRNKEISKRIRLAENMGDKGVLLEE